MTDEGGLHKFMPPKSMGHVADIETFIDDFVSGKVKPVLKSEEVPSDNDSKNVKVLVGKNFNEIVNEEGKDVLVKFYAPWCGHCKAMAPAYNKLGDVFADVEHITIGKFDATNNDVNYDGVDVQGFPTLYLFKSSPGLNGKKEVIAFDGKRTLKGMADFLSKHANKYEISEEGLDIIDNHVEASEPEEPAEGDGDEVVDETNVVVLNSETFKSTIEDNEFVLVEFYAPWCGHCKALKPEYAAAADKLKDSNPNVVVAKLDATKHEAISNKHGVQGFPTIKFFKNGTATDFSGGRHMESIVSYVQRNLRPLITMVEGMNQMDELLSSTGGKNIVFGSFGDDSRSEKLLAIFEDAASTDHLTSFAIISPKCTEEVKDYVASAFEIKLESSKVSHIFFVTVNSETHENEVSEMDLGSCDSPAAILSFTSISRLPMVTVWNENEAEALFSGLQEHFLFGVVKSLGDPLHKEMKEACPRLRKYSDTCLESIARTRATFANPQTLFSNQLSL